MTTQVSKQNAYIGKRYKQISRYKVVDTVGINTSLLTDVISGNVPSRTRWRSVSRPKCNAQRTPLPEIHRFTQNNEIQVKSLRMPGGISLSRYTRVYNSGTGELPTGLATMPGYLVEPHRARCLPEPGRLSALMGSRNSVTYVHRHAIRSRSLPHGAKQADSMPRRCTVTSDLYPAESFASKYVYAQYEKPPPSADKDAASQSRDLPEAEFLYESDSFETTSDDKPTYGRTERPLTPVKIVLARKNTMSPGSKHSDVIVTPRYNVDADVTKNGPGYYSQKAFVHSISADSSPTSSDRHRSRSARSPPSREVDHAPVMGGGRFASSPRTEIRVTSPATVSAVSAVSGGRGQLSEYRHKLENRDSELSMDSDYSDDTYFSYDAIHIEKS